MREFTKMVERFTRSQLQAYAIFKDEAFVATVFADDLPMPGNAEAVTVRCVGCGREAQTPKAAIPSSALNDEGTIAHGMCPDCADKLDRGEMP